MGQFQDLSGHFPPSQKQKGKKNMIFNLLTLQWLKKEITKIKLKPKAGRSNAEKQGLNFSKRKVNNNSSDQHSTKKTKVDNVLKNNGEDETEREEGGIMHDFDYHGTINTESYEKYFKNICKLLKPNSVIIIDNASYHSRNAEDFPVSKWRKAQFHSWLTENKIPFKPDALQSESWTLCTKYQMDKTSKVIDNIAKKYGHKVIQLPPYHCDLNAIELIWADEKK